MRQLTTICLLMCMAFVALAAPAAWAGEADINDVRVVKSSPGTYRFDVTVSHADTGWDHYADAFDIVSPDGTALGTRVLAHPHVNEQPFTRSLGNVRIPNDIQEVHVRAHDKVHALGGKTMRVTLP